MLRTRKNLNKCLYVEFEDVLKNYYFIIFLYSIEDRVLDDGTTLVEVLSAEHTKLLAMTTSVPGTRKRKGSL